MKYVPTFLSLFLFLTSCTPRINPIDDELVPAPVTERFEQKNPRSSYPRWSALSAGRFLVNYVDGSNNLCWQTYQPDGTLLATQTKIFRDLLPGAVTTTLAGQFPEADIENYFRLETPDGRIVYRIELEPDSKGIESLLFSDSGTFQERQRGYVFGR